MMTDREAIEYLKGVGYQASAFSIFEPYYEEGTNYKEAVDALETSVKEQEERSKGCKQCEGLVEINLYRYCPMCGRRLKG